MSLVTSDPETKISKYFTLHELLWLPSWGRLANETDGLTSQILDTLTWFANEKMDKVRDIVGQPILVDCCYRPPAYNSLPSIRGASSSAHLCLEPNVAAMDWYCDLTGNRGADCDTLRARITPYLEGLGLRMEDHGIGAPWIHLDSKPVMPGHGRIFKA